MKSNNSNSEKDRPRGLKIYRTISEDENHISRVAEVDANGYYSYSDYYRWFSSDKLELIRGKVFAKSPAPSLTHQRWCGFLYVKLCDFLSATQYEVFINPFDVRIPDRSSSDVEIFTVVQPDICVVFDQAKLDEKGCVGTPDVVIEVLSAGNNWRELIDKYKVYEEAGVL